MNTRVGCIARQQVRIGSFAPSPSRSLDASVDEDDDVGDDKDDISSSSMTRCRPFSDLPFVICDKKGE